MEQHENGGFGQDDTLLVHLEVHYSSKWELSSIQEYLI